MNASAVCLDSQLDARIEASPGRLQQHVHSLLAHARAGEREAALAQLEHLYTLRGRFHAYALLHQMVLGQQAWHVSGALVVLDAAPLPAPLQAGFDAAIACCASFLDVPAPCILLQCRPEQRDLHLTMESFPGLALLRLSTLSPGYPEDMRAVLYHEVAHCFLTCGVRLLDEGWAHYFAGRHAGATLPDADLTLLPPLRALLSRSADSLFGEDVDSDVAVYRAACRVGADLVQALLDQGGAAHLQRLFAAVARAGSDQEIAQLVEQASGQRFATAVSAPAASGQQLALVEWARQQVFAAWASGQPAALDAVIAALEAQPVYATPALLDSLLGTSIQRAMLEQKCGGSPSSQRLARIELLLKAADGVPPGRLWLWRGSHAMLRIMLARPNLIKVASAGQQALKAYAQAVRLIPDDPDLLIQHAALLLHAPPAYGGDRDLGVSKLRRAMRDPRYAQHARAVLRDYGIVAPPADAAEPPLSASLAAELPAGLPAGLPAASATASPSSASVMVGVHDVELRLSASFVLRPGALTLRCGERVGLVGHNGSGKSVLMEVLLGLRQPDRGTVTLQLGDPQTAATRQRLGALLQGYDWPGQSRVGEMMTLHQAIYQRTDATVTRALGLDELRERAWQQLSRGQRQRVMLWMALAHVPQLVLLDEPSLGLDEWFARALRELLAGLPSTLLVISHAAQDLLAMDRICCLDDGCIVAQGPLEGLVAQRLGQFKASLRQPLSDSAGQTLAALPGLVRPPRQHDGGWELFGGAGFDQTFRQFIAQQRLHAFSLEPVSVEDFLADLSQRPQAAELMSLSTQVQA